MPHSAPEAVSAVIELLVWLAERLLHPRGHDRGDGPTRPVWPTPPERSRFEVACWKVFWTLLALVVIGSLVYITALDWWCNRVAAGAP